jgi:hypothetical protein
MRYTILLITMLFFGTLRAQFVVSPEVNRVPFFKK